MADSFREKVSLDCPTCRTTSLDPIIKKPMYGLWWCKECHKVFSKRFEYEDIIDPHGRI